MDFDDKDFDDEQSFDIPDEDIESKHSAEEFEKQDHPVDEEDSVEEEAKDDSENIDNIYYALLAGISLVLIYLLYKVYGFMVPMDERPIVAVEKPKPAQVEPVAPKPVKPAVVQPKPQVITRIVEQKSDGKTAEQLSSIQDLLERQQSSISDIKADDDYLVRLNNAQKEQLSKLMDRMDKLERQLTAIQTLQVEQKQKQQITAKPKMPKTIPELWTVRAMIDGRAWIQSSKGRTMTVAVGTAIQGYGIVESIAVESGVIMTSSGKAIMFKSQEAQ